MQSRAATAALLAATAVWGATFVTVKDALAASDTFTFLALRFGVGAVAAALLSLLVARPSTQLGMNGAGTPGMNGAGTLGPLGVNGAGTLWRNGAVLKVGLGLGLVLFGGYALQTLGLERTTPARSAFVTGLTVIFVPFVSWALNRTRPPVRAFVAPLVALVGLQRLTGVSWSDTIPPGDALTLGCAVLYAFHIAGTGKYGKGLPSLALTAVQLAVVALLSAGLLPFVERRFEPTPSYWGAVLFTGVVASALAIGVQVWAQTKLTAVRAAVIYSLEPVFALAWALVTGLGWPTAAELVGGAFILLAVLISEVSLSPVGETVGERGSAGSSS